ncbi:MAG: restriction endonuclease [Thaumarchaeota archaeon]|nr:restriction endonuclease [Nitrososphaerota archaeon]
MAFCTNCGEALKGKYKFCPKCGGAVEAPADQAPADQAPADQAPARGTGAPSSSTDNSPYVVDRKTLFDDGMLVMTSNNLILYSNDERDELLRIPASKIESCGYSMMRRKLVVKHRTNEEEGLERQIVQKERDIKELEFELEEIKLKKGKLKSKGKKDLKPKIAELTAKAGEIQQQLDAAKKAQRDLKNDPETISRTKKEEAETQSTSFQLRSGSRDEYRIWEHVINRRAKGAERIKVETVPYGAIVMINGEPVGTTPFTAEKPIVDKAILAGKYDLSLLLEGHEVVHKHVPVGVGGDSAYERITLDKLESHNGEIDAQAARARAALTPQTVDLAQCGGILREVECANEKIVLLTNELLIVSKPDNELYYNIPYGTINSIRYAGGLFGRIGTKRIRIEYSEPDYQDLSIEATLDDCGGKVSETEVRRRSESLVNLVLTQRDNSGNMSTNDVPRPPQHYEITEQDIKTKFARFDPIDFEKVIMKLFEKMGYSASVGNGRGDFGADVIAKGKGETIVIQVKKWDSPVGGPDVHKTLGCMHTFSANRAIVVTTSDFTNQAYEIRDRDTPVELWNWDRLRDEARTHLLE